MLFRTCQAPGCSRTSGRYSRFCAVHKARSRRHGGPDQRAVTKAELAPYERTARGWVTRNPQSPVWPQAEAAWRQLVDHAKATLTSSSAGFRWEHRAAREIIKVSDDVPPMDILATVTALFLMQADQPARFTSDDAFRVQLSRRVRSLTRVNAGEWIDREGRRKLAYKELPPKAALAFAAWTLAALGGIAVYLTRAETRKRAEDEARQQTLNEALTALR